MTLLATWTRLSTSENTKDLARSSHSLAVVGQKAYIFGGEQKPRTPVDEGMHIIDLKSGEIRSILVEAGAVDAGKHPNARVGSAITAVGTIVYMWGGRSGKAMSPSDATLWKFDTLTESWSKVEVGKADKEEDEPECRSYHVLTSVENTLFLHAGCPAKGRLPTLHSLDLSSPSPTWKRLPDAPGPGRGGTNLSLLPTQPPLLARFGGFAGHEVGGLSTLPPNSNSSWTDHGDLPSSHPSETSSSGPDARSVAGFVGLSKPFKVDAVSGGGEIVALLFLGEREPTAADVGHDGAGCFHDDVWALKTFEDEERWEWEGPLAVDGEVRPKARGWFGYDRVEGGDGEGVAVLFGGLNEENGREGDIWMLGLTQQ